MSTGPGSDAPAQPDPGPSYAFTPATPPMPAPGSVDVQVVGAARVTRYLAGTIPTEGRPDRWISGAVYDADLMLVEGSQRRRGLTLDRVAACDPARIPEPVGAAGLAGTWVYGGHFMHPFGHFLTETLTNLWPRPEEQDGVAGLLFHRWLQSEVLVHDWQAELLDAAGWGEVPVKFVRSHPLRAERLLVPERSFRVGAWATPEAVRVWRRVSEHLAARAGTTSPARVYLSRSRFHAERRRVGRVARVSVQRDAALERDFAAAGFEIVYPEELSLPEQAATVRDAQVVAGAAGSALHLAAFAAGPIRVVEVGDRRSPDDHLPGQRIVDAACGHLHAFVPHRVPAARVLADLDL